MAHRRGYRLPRSDAQFDTAAMEHWLHKLGLTVQWFLAWTGYAKLSDWKNANPQWPLAAFVGLLLEECEQEIVRRIVEDG